MKKYFNNFIENSSIILVIVGALSVSILLQLGIIPASQVPMASFGVIVALTIFVVVKLHKIGSQVSYIDNHTKDIKQHITGITSSTILIGSEELFGVVNSVLKSDSTIDVTSFSNIVVTDGISGEELNKYLNFTKKNLLKNNKFRLRRIGYAPDIEKLSWLEKTVDETRKSKNYHLTILEKNLNLPLINMFIIDRKYLFLFGKHRADRESEYSFVVDVKLAKTFLRYYDELWSSSTPIKIGNKVYDDNIKAIKLEINNQLDTEKQVKRGEV